MRVTIKEIAEILGMSVSTISLALRNHSSISEETRRRALDQASKMGYTKHIKPTPSSVKFLQLVVYKKHGSVIADTDFFSILFQCIEKQTKERGYSLIISYFYENQNHEEQLRSIMSSNCRGIILLATEMQKNDMKHFSQINIPILILDNYFPQVKYDCVGINNIQGACSAVEYLISCGHTEIGHISSKVIIRNFHERSEGYKKGLKSIDIPNSSKLRIVKVSPTPEGAVKDFSIYLKTAESLPTAFFADNDIIAFSAIRVLKEFGYSIPEDISIIGFDDLRAAEMIDPPLTTLNVSKKSLSTLAVNRLVELVENKTNEVVRIQVAANVVDRKSVKILRR